MYKLEAMVEYERYIRISSEERVNVQYSADKQVAKWWMERGAWRDDYDAERPSRTIASWKWRNESPSPEPEDLLPIMQMKESPMDAASDVEFTPSEVDALEAIHEAADTAHPEDIRKAKATASSLRSQYRSHDTCLKLLAPNEAQQQSQQPPRYRNKAKSGATTDRDESQLPSRRSARIAATAAAASLKRPAELPSLEARPNKKRKRGGKAVVVGEASAKAPAKASKPRQPGTTNTRQGGKTARRRRKPSPPTTHRPPLTAASKQTSGKRN